MGTFDISPARYRLKKIARRAAVALGRAIRAIGTTEDGSIRVLTYHRFGDSPLDAFCLPPGEFDAELAWLRNHAHVLTPQEFIAAMSDMRPLPECSVLLTVDDGHRSTATHALPRLEHYGFKAVLFVCPQLVGTKDSEYADDFMTWEELAAAQSRGHVIAPHGYTHRSLGRMPIAAAIDEIDRAHRALQSRLGTATPFFAFPFGTRADFSQQLGQVLVQRGFRYCFTSVHGHCMRGSDSVLLPRIKIEGRNEYDLFPDIVRGCIDHWRLIDHTLFLIQQRGRM